MIELFSNIKNMVIASLSLLLTYFFIRSKVSDKKLEKIDEENTKAEQKVKDFEAINNKDTKRIEDETNAGLNSDISLKPDTSYKL
jgi:hypothetical protein